MTWSTNKELFLIYRGGPLGLAIILVLFVGHTTRKHDSFSFRLTKNFCHSKAKLQ